MSLKIGWMSVISPWNARKIQAAAVATSILDSELHLNPKIDSETTLKVMYLEYFSDIGKLKDSEYHINIDKKC